MIDAVFAVRVDGEVVKTVSLREGLRLLQAALDEAGGDPEQARQKVLEALEGLKRKV